MKHVVMVAFHYPPEASSSGVLRTLKFSRYLGDFGWKVSVLTLAEDAYSVTDAGLRDQVPDSVNVVRTRFVELRKRLSVAGRYPSIIATPDPWIGWYPYAVRAGVKIAVAEPVSAVFSTSPHPTAHLIARRLSKSLRVPHVADFRDPWYEFPPEPGTPALVHWCAQRLERRVISNAAHVVASTTQLRDALRERHSSLEPGKFSAILNGYDEADFASLGVSGAPKGQRLVLLHAGNINPEFRDPRPLFEAIGRLVRVGAIERSEIALRFIGAGPYAQSREVAASIDAAGLNDAVAFLPRMSYQDALQEMARSDLLLLLQASADTTSLVPAKLYEYLRASRPVLALVRRGATDEVLTSVGGGWCCDPRDQRAVDGCIREIVERWREGRLAEFAADLDRLRQFDRKVLTRNLAEILHRVTAPDRTRPQSA